MTTDERIRANSRVLERIAKTFAKDSEESKALKASALAFGFVMLTCETEFDHYVKDLHKPLSSRELARLRSVLKAKRRSQAVKMESLHKRLRKSPAGRGSVGGGVGRA